MGGGFGGYLKGDCPDDDYSDGDEDATLAVRMNEDSLLLSLLGSDNEDPQDDDGGDDDEIPPKRSGSIRAVFPTASMRMLPLCVADLNLPDPGGSGSWYTWWGGR